MTGVEYAFRSTNEAVVAAYTEWDGRREAFGAALKDPPPALCASDGVKRRAVAISKSSGRVMGEAIGLEVGEAPMPRGWRRREFVVKSGALEVLVPDRRCSGGHEAAIALQGLKLEIPDLPGMPPDWSKVGPNGNMTTYGPHWFEHGGAVFVGWATDPVGKDEWLHRAPVDFDFWERCKLSEFHLALESFTE